MSPALQRAALMGVAVCAAILVGATAWYVAGVLAPVIGLFFGGWLLALVLEPCVNGIVRVARAHRPGAVLATYVLAVLVLVGTWLLVAPSIARQVDNGFANAPVHVEAAARDLALVEAEVNPWLADRGIPLQVDIESAVRALQLGVRADAVAANAVTVGTGVLSAFGSFAVMLLLSLFYLIDGPKLADRTAQAFGGRFFNDVRFVQTAVHDAFESYLRTQLLQAILYAFGVWVCLALVGVETAPLLGVASGVLLIIPVVGAVLAVALPVVATLLWNPSATIAIGLALVALEQLVLNVVGPRLMSRQSGLPPLVLLFGVFAGGQLGGLWGAVFGVPVLAALLTCAGYFRERVFPSTCEEGDTHAHHSSAELERRAV